MNGSSGGQVADESGDGDHHGAVHDGGRLDRLQVQFLVHYHGQPCFAVGGDGVHDLLQQVPAEAVSGVDVANLLAFGFRGGVDLGRLPRLFGLVALANRLAVSSCLAPRRASR
jgi:hypothetical protein